MVGPLIIIVGETASGKSTLAIDLARRFNGELICADATTVYREFDIGTAKPSDAERLRVPHHLLDVADAASGYSAPMFQRAAKRAIEDIHARGKLPIMVGGTGLYVDCVLYDYSFLEQANPREREILNGLSLSELLIYAERNNYDVSRIDQQNKRRVIRLIENKGVLPGSSPERPNTLVIGIVQPREELDKRIESRVDTMIEQGLEGEAKTLSIRYGWDVEPMKAIGYREWREYFGGSQSRLITRERIIAATRRLAKKQRTWFKRNNSIHWTHNRDEAVELVTTFLNK